MALITDSIYKKYGSIKKTAILKEGKLRIICGCNIRYEKVLGARNKYRKFFYNFTLMYFYTNYFPFVLFIFHICISS